MHEISLIRSTFRTLEDSLSAEEYAHLTDIHLRVGQLSGVEPVLLQSAFEAVVNSEFAARTLRLHIEVLPTMIRCPVCDQTTEVVQMRFVCGHCQRPCSHIVQGNELLISRIETQSPTAS